MKASRVLSQGAPASSSTTRAPARVRAALIAVDNETLDQVRARVAPLDTPENGFRHAARELVGPIIAMTITLAAVYTPVGIQGGLTGALFREFAFTLAGAVIVSGVVALTLSPMMGSKLLPAGSFSMNDISHK